MKKCIFEQFLWTHVFRAPFTYSIHLHSRPKSLCVAHKNTSCTLWYIITSKTKKNNWLPINIWYKNLKIAISHPNIFRGSVTRTLLYILDITRRKQNLSSSILLPEKTNAWKISICCTNLQSLARWISTESKI